MRITSDLHFYHKNILAFCPARGYSNLDEMHFGMIKEWNRSVAPQEEVWILGDLSFGNTADTASILEQLNGKLHMVLGNHDNKTFKCPVVRRRFESIQDYKELTFNRTKIVMFHYPIWEWNDGHRGAVHFHGHTHGKPTGIRGRILDVGYDATGQVVSDMLECIEKAKKEPVYVH